MVTLRRTLVAAVAVLGLSVVGCGADPIGDENVGSHHDHGATTAGGTGEFDVGLGGPVSLSGEGFELTYAVTDLTVATTDDRGQPPAEQDLLVVASVEVQVYQGSHDPGDPDTGFELSFVTDDGIGYPRSEQPVGSDLAGVVSAGESLVGTVVFAVPSTAVDSGRVRLTAVANGGDQTIYWNIE